mmetsp:Transcript_17554/g.32489  ORF Transcript_17554/g.32489 Transcript_17554/m.32489 type:complete len:144 (+) Transcript_17554:590-1021(+)
MVVLLGVGVISPSGVPKEEQYPPSWFVAFLKKASPIRYAIEAVCIAEYDGMEFQDMNSEPTAKNPFRSVFRKARDVTRMGGLALVKRGNEILEELGLANESYQGSLEKLAILSLGFLAISWIGLTFQHGPKVASPKHSHSNSS